MKDTPRNQQGQPPTHDPKETEERLEEKEQEGQGEANRERIEAKIDSLDND